MAGKPGVSSTVPKRDAQRRYKRAGPCTDTVDMTTTVEVPELGLDDVHPLAKDFYESLAISGQSRYYEPSDWQRARVMIWSLSKMLDSGRPSAMLIAALQKDMADLLVSEAERRRVRMEISRGVPDTSERDARVSQMAAYRRVAGN